jgi:hypothetical protein
MTQLRSSKIFGTLRYYKNASLEKTVDYIPAQTTANNLFIGGFGCTSLNPCCFLEGKLDDFRIYTRLLTSHEIEALFNLPFQRK